MAKTGKIFLILLGLFTLGATTAQAATVDNFVPRRYTNSQGVLPYRLFIPANYNPSNSYPIVLFLHGAGERGSDNRLQLTGQTGALVFASETNQAKYPSFMIAPQCPTGGAWADTVRRAQVLGLMNALQSEFSIDAARLYITGLSMGGIGSWDYLTQFPNMYAAAIPMSGNGNNQLASRITHIPIWNFHSANDSVVSVAGSRTMVNAVRRAGGNVIYTEYASGGHGIWTPAYNTPILMDWVFAQKRGMAPTNAPLLTITAPTTQPLYSSTNISNLNLAGIASDGNSSVTLVTWTNFQDKILGGTATGTTDWSVTNISLHSSVTNLILITARGTSWYPGLGGNTTFNDTLAVIFPPFILQQPQSQTANQGETVTFNVGVAANRALSRYQWRFNELALGGKTNSSLIISNVQSSHAGNYSVQVMNSFGSVLSSDATLSVNHPPVADSQSLSVNEDTPIAIILTASDADSDALTYTVMPPAHGTLSGVAPILSYLPSPNYNGPDSFAFKVNDGRLDSSLAVVSITVGPVNDSPLAEAGPNQRVNEGDGVTFNGGGSMDIEGDSLNYAWDFGDGSIGLGVAPTHAYADNGVYTVKLIVTDIHKAMNMDSLTVTVLNVNPIANAGSDEEEVVGDLVTFGGSFTDAGSADTHTFAWDFGDGTNVLPATLTPTHIFSHYGLYTVTLTVTDDDGGVGSDTLTLTLVSALGYLEQTVAKLTPYQNDVRKVGETTKRLRKLLGRRWLDEVHVLPKDGPVIFHGLKQIADELTHLLKDKKGNLSDEVVMAVECAIDNVVKAARLLAQTLLIEVDGMTAVDPERQHKVDQELAKAREEFAEAAAEHQKDDHAKAIDHYRKAWEHATHAEEEATRN